MSKGILFKLVLSITFCFLFISQSNYSIAKSVFNSETKVVSCDEPLPIFTLDEKSQPSNKEISNLCSCIWKKIPQKKWREISKKARDGSVKSEEEQFLADLFATPFREAFIACGGQKFLAETLKPTWRDTIFVNKYTVKQIFNTNHKAWVKQTERANKMQRQKGTLPCPSDPPWNALICVENEIFASFVLPYYGPQNIDKPVGLIIHYSFKDANSIDKEELQKIFNDVKKDLHPEYILNGKVAIEPTPQMTFEIVENY